MALDLDNAHVAFVRFEIPDGVPVAITSPSLKVIC